MLTRLSWLYHLFSKGVYFGYGLNKIKESFSFRKKVIKVVGRTPTFAMYGDWGGGGGGDLKLRSFLRSSTTHIFVRHSQSCTKIRGGKCPSSRMFYQFMNKKSCSEPISLNFWIRPRSMYIPPTFWVPCKYGKYFLRFSLCHLQSTCLFLCNNF